MLQSIIKSLLFHTSDMQHMTGTRSPVWWIEKCQQQQQYSI